jgi:hypothetical protein
MRRQAARLEALRFEARLALTSYNGDKTADGADFLRWQRGPSPTPFSQQYLNVWKANDGRHIKGLA